MLLTSSAKCLIVNGKPFEMQPGVAISRFEGVLTEGRAIGRKTYQEVECEFVIAQIIVVKEVLD